MATLEERTQTIADYVETYTGRSTFITDSNYTQPDTPYCTVKIIDITYSEKDIVEDVDGFSEKVRGLARLTCSIQAIGGDESAGTGANKVLHRLKASFTASLPRQVLEAEEIGVQILGKVTDLSIVVGSKIEERALINIDLSASIAETFTFDSATEVNIDLDAGPDPAQQITVPQDPPDCPAGG